MMIEQPQTQDHNDNQTDKGQNSPLVFSREPPSFINKDSTMSKKLKSRDSDDNKKLSRQDRVELGRLLQTAVSSHNWEFAESLILVADPQTLNDALCITLDSIWFLTTDLELNGITLFIRKIIANGAYDFTRATLRTSFLASCV